ncbi:Alcohol dehydrogenase, class IV [Psychrobacter nivimaris]|uniref:Alcohol dehydrogenase, class IV n=1 Tax=Psychrobacter nivimaris TaxID=281738 RepID=A0A6N7BVR9_9GAMM|nr:TIGR03643 family protein [Psychrobacter nivimaris]KAF0568458.1 Alcohol dehydrogenase, class IV [Psychrobacter nivimaris]
MASYQDLTASNPKNKSADTSSTKATMQADMDAALQHKQRSNDCNDEVSQAKSDELIAKTVNDAGDRVLDDVQISRVIEMAWEDRTPFGAIEHSYGLDETGVIKLMRQELKPSSFSLWRQRVSNRATKHEAKRSFEVGRAYCKTQYKQR